MNLFSYQSPSHGHPVLLFLGMLVKVGCTLLCYFRVWLAWNCPC